MAKMKQFKRQSDLIKHATKRAIHRCDVEMPARMKMINDDYILRNPPDFLQEAGQKLKGLR